jgi:hypothetical protein
MTTYAIRRKSDGRYFNGVNDPFLHPSIDDAWKIFPFDRGHVGLALVALWDVERYGFDCEVVEVRR